MCFSASASFSVASALFITSAYTITKASAQYKRIAYIPLFFGLQQACEGIVWYTYNDHSCVTTAAAYGFLFFATMFWPVWFSYAILPFESTYKKRVLIYGTLIIGALFSCTSFIILAVYGAHATIEGHHVKYLFDMPTSVKNLYESTSNVSRIWYLCASIVPTLLSSNIPVRILGIVAGGAYIGTRAFFGTWFISIWCFFAALVSVGVAIIIQRSHHK